MCLHGSSCWMWCGYWGFQQYRGWREAVCAHSEKTPKCSNLKSFKMQNTEAELVYIKVFIQRLFEECLISFKCFRACLRLALPVKRSIKSGSLSDWTETLFPLISQQQDWSCLWDAGPEHAEMNPTDTAFYPGETAMALFWEVLGQQLFTFKRISGKYFNLRNTPDRWFGGNFFKLQSQNWQSLKSLLVLQTLDSDSSLL